MFKNIFEVFVSCFRDCIIFRINSVLLIISAVLMLSVPPVMRYILMENNRSMIREVVKSAYSIVEWKYKNFTDGNISEVDAKKEAIEILSSIRFGKDNSDYIFIINSSYIMVSHPIQKYLVGRNMDSLRNSNEVNHTREMVKVSMEGDGGFVQYRWYYKQDDRRLEDKISYVKYFKPWDWVIGIGIFLVDVNNKIVAAYKTTGFVVLLLIIILMIQLFLSQSRSRNNM